MYAMNIIKVGLTDKEPRNGKDVEHAITRRVSSIAYRNTEVLSHYKPADSATSNGR